MLEGAETARFWDITLPPMRRGAFRWQRLLDAPVIALPLADPRAYTERYSEADKQATGLGAGVEAWPAPYWTIDASMSVMTMLLPPRRSGSGRCSSASSGASAQLRRALGHPGGDAGARRRSPSAGRSVNEETGEITGGGPTRRASTTPARPAPAAQPPHRRRTPDEIIHRRRLARSS